MNPIRKFEIVKVVLPGAPIDGRKGVVLDSDMREGQWYYSLDVEGDDCSWKLPETPLQPTGQIDDRQRGWNGCKYTEGDRVAITAPKGKHDKFLGLCGTVYAGKPHSGTCVYTVELDDGQILLLVEDELGLEEPSNKDGLSL